ncbi:MAG: hypothetical protein ABIT69_02035 [Sphingomicrobium sp.]
MARQATERQTALRKAMALVGKAMDLLDAAEAPPQVTAHLELALAEIRAALES